MNNKGQVLVLFVLLIPILLLGAAYIIDNVYISYHTNKLNGINSLVANDTKDNNLSFDDIVQYAKKNDENVDVEINSLDNNKIEIKLTKNIKSLFGVIIGIHKYTLSSSRIVEFESEDISS